MGDSCNVHKVCACENHDLPTYEEAMEMISPRGSFSGRTTIVAPKRETNHDRQPLSVTSLRVSLPQPTIDSTRQHARNTNYTQEPSSTYRNNTSNTSYVSRNSRTPLSYNNGPRFLYQPRSNGIRRYDTPEEAAVDRKEEPFCHSGFIQTVIIVFGVFALLALLINIPRLIRGKSSE